MKIKSLTNKSNKFTAILFVAYILIFASCKKGDTGPAGETGPQGPQGTPGPTAIYTDITANYNGSSSLFTYSSYANLDNSIILVYFKDQANNNSLVQTPFLWYNGTSSPVAYLFSEVEKSSCSCNDLIKIYAQKPNFSQTTPAFTVATTLAFRIVEIKTTQRTINPDSTLLPMDLSYNSVKKHFGLQD